MREFWLTDESGIDKWSFGTTSRTPLVDVKGLGSKADISYWQGNYVSVATKKKLSRVSCTGTIAFLQGDKSFEEFERWIGNAEAEGDVWLWCKRTGCSPRKCKVQIESLERAESIGIFFTASISMSRLTPWYGSTHKMYLDELSSHNGIIMYYGDVPCGLGIDAVCNFTDYHTFNIKNRSHSEIFEFLSYCYVEGDYVHVAINFNEGEQNYSFLYAAQDFSRSGTVFLRAGRNNITLDAPYTDTHYDEGNASGDTNYFYWADAYSEA